jgi:endonuclease-8
MPEGDTLFRIARALQRVIAGRTLEDLRTARPLGAHAPRRGLRVGSVEARGKNLLVHFEGGAALRVHLGMTGAVHLYRPGEPWRRPAWTASLALEFAEAVVVVCRAALVRAVLHPRLDAALATLGPDILAEDFDAAEACRRLRAQGAVPIGDALLDQRSVAGIGNVYKCEALFVCGLDPFAKAASLDDARLDALLATARTSMRENLGDGPRRTRAGAKAGSGASRPSARASTRHWVYGRAGRPCFLCGTLVRAKRAGPRARVTWYCPQCQGVAGSVQSHRSTDPASATIASSRRSSASSPASASAASARVPFKSRSRSRSAS